MNERPQDFELLQRFTRDGEQSAFADVVRRHLDLVFGTALRKVEDPGAAQEVAQNVFAALGRKAWQFGPDDSLPAWLHKAALLEAKSWLRGELGRRRREQTAAELGTTMNTPEEQPAFAELLPLLDEALLSLRERDRTALLLRFYENQSLRDVGAALGAGEDAAAKRVQRALDKLTQFFQRRGFKTASVAAVAAALAHSATTASAEVATSLVGAAHESAPPTLVGFKALLARLVVLTRPQRAALGGALAIALLLLLCLFLARTLEAATKPVISIERSGTNVVIQFTGALERADQPQGPFRPEPNNGSPLVVPAGAGQEFWRAWLPGVRTIAAGWRYTVALRTDGTLWAWGLNENGQLGIGTYTNTDLPQQVGSETNWQAVAAGFDHTVGLRTDGTLWAWGYNRGEGDLGIGTSTDTNTPQRIGNDTNWQAVTAGQHYTVGLRTDGTLWAWGYNYNGELGIGTVFTNAPYGTNTPQQIGSDTNWQAVVAGDSHTVALRADGTLWAWGANYNGELGIGTFKGTNTPQRIGTNANWQAVVAGSGHTVALRTDGTLWAWGANDAGQLGIGTFTTNAPYDMNTPQRIGTDTNWQAIAAGESSHAVALRSDGTLWTWGYNRYGGLGIGTVTTNKPYGINTPQQVGTNTNWGWREEQSSGPEFQQQPVASQLASGMKDFTQPQTSERTPGNLDTTQFSLPSPSGRGLMASNGLAQTGGQVVAWGDNHLGQTNVPVAAQSGVVAIAIGSYHVVALKNDGSVAGWGAGTENTHGTPNFGQSIVPTAAQSGVVAIAAGPSFSAALKKDGRVLVWGYGKDGLTNVPVAAQSGVRAIATARNASHLLALKDNGSVVAWGYNRNGSTAVPAAAQSGVVAIASGLEHDLALKDDGSVVAWGGLAGQTNVPAAAQSGVTAVAAGGWHSLALKRDGSVVAWGDENNSDASSVPAAAHNGVTAIAAGYHFSLALKRDGSVLAWGQNNCGQTNVPPTARKGVVAISAGADHAVALTKDGTVVAWGRNDHGQTNVPEGLTGVTAVVAGNDITVVLRGGRWERREPPPSGQTAGRNSLWPTNATGFTP